MGGSSGGGGSSSGGTTVIRYADYIEARHAPFLAATATYRDSVIANTPYNGLEDIPVDVGFFGAGYVLASFPSLYDMFGKFVAGMNIEALWEEIYASTINSVAVNSLVSAESALMSDELDTTIMPRFQAGMRDLNAVMTSTFIVGKALLEDTRQKALAKFSSELRFRMLPVAQDRWKTHLAWNQEVINSYANIMKHFFTVKHGIRDSNYSLQMKKSLWPLTVMDFERANLGALQGAVKSSTGSEESGGKSVLGGALAGAAAGGMVAGPWGAAIGGVLGGVASIL